MPRAIRVALEVRQNIILHFWGDCWPNMTTIFQVLPDDWETHDDHRISFLLDVLLLLLYRDMVGA